MKEQRRRVTQREVALRAQVSQGVVSVVLNNAPTLHLILPETRERVLQAARELDYRVNLCARQLRSGKSRLVNIVSPVLFSHHLQNLIPLIETELSKAGYRIVISRLNDRDPGILESVRDVMSMDFAGTIVLDHFDSYSPEVSRRVLAAFAEYSRVVYLRPPPGYEDECHAVDIDYAVGMRQAVAHLQQHGRRRIALALNDLTCSPMQGRKDGYCRQLRASGQGEVAELVWVAAESGMVGLDGSRPEFIARRFYEQVIAPNRVDGVITSNDEWAVALIKVLRREGIRVPDEIAVVGYGDNPDLCWASEPELSSINHGETRVARELAELLLLVMEDDLKPTVRRVESFFVPRASSAPTDAEIRESDIHIAAAMMG